MVNEIYRSLRKTSVRSQNNQDQHLGEGDTSNGQDKSNFILEQILQRYRNTSG